ncbi:unnamed protein product, partial [Closterium sp. NIES-54]
VAVGSGAPRADASGGAASGGAEPGGAEYEGAETGGAKPGGVANGGGEPGGFEPEGVEPRGAASEGAKSGGAEPQGAASSGGSAGASSRLSPQQLREWFVWRTRLQSAASGARGTGVAAGAGVTGGTATTGPGGARTRGTGAAETGGVEGAGVRDLPESGAPGAGGARAGAGVGGTGTGGAGVGGPDVGGAGAGGAGGAGAVDPGGAIRPRPYFPASPLPAPSPYTEQSGGHTEHVSPVRTPRRVPRSRPPPVLGTHAMNLRPSSVPLCLPLPAPPESSLPEVPDPESDLARAVSPSVSHLLAIAVIDPSFQSAAASALVAELLDFAAAFRLDYTTALVTDSTSAGPPSVGPAEMASWKSTGTYVDEVPPPGANIVDGMWIFRVKRPPSSLPTFKEHYVARGFSQRKGVDYFQTFSPTPKMTTLWVLLLVAAQRDYESHSLDFSTTFLQGSLHEEIWLRRPLVFTESFPAGTQWSLRRPVYGLRQAPHEWHDTLKTTRAALGFAPATADPSLFLRTDTSLPLFYVLVYVDDLVFATADTEALTLDRARRTITLPKSHMVHQVLQRFGFQFSSPQLTPLSTSHSLSAPPSDESVEPSDASWVDNSATQRSSQGYTFSLGSGSISWRSTRSSLVLSSSCEAEIYAGAMAAQELRWLTYLLTDLGEQPRSPPVLYVDNKAMIALCQEHRLEHRTKHIALRHFLARELMQRGQLHLAYVATRANTADIFTKALPPARLAAQRAAAAHAATAVLCPAKQRSPGRAAPPSCYYCCCCCCCSCYCCCWWRCCWECRRSRRPAPPSRPAATTAASAARATTATGGGAAGSTGGAAGAGGAGPTTNCHCMSWPLSRQLQRLGVDSLVSGYYHCLSRTTPPLISFVRGLIKAAALGSSESDVAPGAGESAAALGARESAGDIGSSASIATGPASTEALHTFTLDSSASRCFFRDCTTITPLVAPIPVSLADPTGGQIVAQASTVLPCMAIPSESLSGLHLPMFSTNLLSNAVLQDEWLAESCSCQVLSHRHPSLTRLRSMHSRLLVSGLPKSLPSLPRSRALPCLLCVEGQQRATPHSSEFPPTIAPLQTLHMDVWGPAPVGGMDQERYFLLVVDDYTRYTTVFPLQRKADVSGVLIPWIHATRRQLRKRFGRDFPVLRLHSDRGGEFSSASRSRFRPLLSEMGLLSLNLWPRVFEQETSPTLRWTGKVGDASVFLVWGALSLVRDAKASKLSSRTLRCIFLGFPTDTPPWQFYHPQSRRVFSSQDITFDESVCFYRLHPHASHPVPLAPLFLTHPPWLSLWRSLLTPLAQLRRVTPPLTTRRPLAALHAWRPPPGFPPWPSLPPPQPAAVDYGAETAGAEPGGAETEGEGSGGAAIGGAGSWGFATGGADSGGAVSPSGGGAVGDPVGGPGARQPPQPDLLETLSPQAFRAWIVRRGSPGGGRYGPAGAGAASHGGTVGAGGTGGTAGGAGCAAGAGGTRGAAGAGGGGATSPRGATGAGGAGPTSPGGTVGAGGAGGANGARGLGARGTGCVGAAGPGGARTGGVGAAGASGVVHARGATGAAGSGGTGGTTGAGGAGAAEAGGIASARSAGGATGAAGSGGAGGTAGAGGAGAVGIGGIGVAGAGGAADHGGARTRGAGAARSGGAAGAGGAGGATGAADTGGARGTASEVLALPKIVVLLVLELLLELLVLESTLLPPDSVLRQVLSLPTSTGVTPPLLYPATNQSQPQLLPGSPLLAPAPHTNVTESLTERHEPETRASTPLRARRVACPCSPTVPGTHGMTLRPSSVPQRVVLPEPPTSSLPHVLDPESDLAPAANPTVTRLLATVVTNPDFESTAAFARVSELVDYAARSRLDYVAILITESETICPPSVRGECALSSDVLEDRQFELECLAAALPHFSSMLLCPEGDPDALDIPTPRSYAEAIAGEYSSQWQTIMDAEMASWKSTGTYVDEVPALGANIVDGMWIFIVKRPPGSPPAFKARYVARGFRQRQGVDFFQTFSPTPKMTTLRVLLHVAAQCDYELHSLEFSTAFLQGILHEEIWLRGPHGFTGSFHDYTCGSWVWSFNCCPSLFLCTNTTLPPFYVLVYADDLVFATADTEALALVKAELQERHTCTDLGELCSYLGLQITRDRARRTITLTHSQMVHQVLQRFGFQFSSPQPTPLSTGHLLSAPPSDDSVEPSGPFP